MASKTFIVTIEYDAFHTTSHARSALRRLGDVYSLDCPDEWPTEVWVAFERAQANRTHRNVEATDTRRDTGNTLVHPPVRVSPAETLADHSPLHFPEDTGQRTAPHGVHRA